MNRRNFFKTTALGVGATVLAPTITGFRSVSDGGSSGTTGAIRINTREYWKQHFRDTTQEYNLTDMVKNLSGQKGMDEYCKLLSSRYCRDTHVQMKNCHTDEQIDKLPNKSGPYQIYRLQYKHNRKDYMPTTEIMLVSTSILLEV